MIPFTGRWGNFLIKMTANLTLTLLPRAVQQLKLLPRVDSTSHFLYPRADKKPHFNGPRVKKKENLLTWNEQKPQMGHRVEKKFEKRDLERTRISKIVTQKVSPPSPISFSKRCPREPSPLIFKCKRGHCVRHTFALSFKLLLSVWNQFYSMLFDLVF